MEDVEYSWGKQSFGVSRHHWQPLRRDHEKRRELDRKIAQRWGKPGLLRPGQTYSGVDQPDAEYLFRQALPSFQRYLPAAAPEEVEEPLEKNQIGAYK